MVFAVVTVSGLFAQTGTIKGKVLDGESGEPIPFANVSVLQDGKVITGGMTDFDGKYTIKPVPVGKFTVNASYMGYKTIALSNVQINNSKITFQDFKLPSSVSKLAEVVVMDYKVPLISKDQVESGGTISQEDIDKMPGRSASAVAATVGGVNSDKDGNLNVRGARSEGTVFYVDGVKVMGSTLPKSAIEQVNVITGGLGAKYGDATGGIVNITTRGASKEFHGGIEFVTSELLDGYGYSLGGLTVTGPIWSKKSVDPYDSTKIVKKPIIGFLVTGDVTYRRESNPDIKGVWKANDGVRDDILENPYIVESGFSGMQSQAIVNNSSDYFDEDKFTLNKIHDNNASLSYNVNGKININVTDNLLLAIGGRYRYMDRAITTDPRRNGRVNTLFNTENHGQYNYNNWAVNARITHKFSNKSEEDEQKSASVLKNVYYQLVGSYEKEGQKWYDKNYDDKLFNYGHVGEFNTYQERTYAFTDTLSGYSHGIYLMTAFADTAITFAPSQYNEELSKYTEYYYSLFPSSGTPAYVNKTNIEAFGGLLNGQSPDQIYGKFNAPATPYNSYRIIDDSQFIFSGNGSADIGDHEFQIGFEFEQKDERSFSSSPMGLWQLARQAANFHLSNLDYDNPIRHSVTDANGNTVYMDTISYERKYSPGSQKMFDIKFRQHLASQGALIDGEAVTVNGTQFLDVDSYDPNELDIEYFSADELINDGQSLVSYFGYDAYGNRLTSNPTLDDFFNETNDLGFKTRPIAAFKPNYLAFYIQDKFSFDDLVFRVGLRVDRYDANQQVLKDAYSLNSTYSVGDVRGSNHASLLKGLPLNISDDYVVYADNVNIADAQNILGYRTGDNPADVKWYNASGTQITDPTEIASATGMTPLLVEPVTYQTIDGQSIPGGPKTNVNDYTDYVPQWNVMPRIAFSFPISDVALFSAHYDVMTKRPFGVNRLNPLNYLHLQSYAGGAINNPNLKPETTIEYELGFQQKVSNTSSLKIVAFYRENRDQAQVQNITGAFPNNYITFSNIDFGTVKGLTVSYDLRRTGNISAKVAYTLQFANGTGSDAQTALKLIQQQEPNLRATLPLSFDQRHVIKANVDYSFTEGKGYNGPVLFGKDILQNTGVSFVVSYNTGTPYSKKDPENDNLLGSINGSRLPDVFSTNMKIYRDFAFNQGKDKKHPLNLQVYLEVLNLFNTFNVTTVFDYTGNADDDAYLSTAKNQADIQSQLDPSAYGNYYGMDIDMRDYYQSPRFIRLGVTLGF